MGGRRLLSLLLLCLLALPACAGSDDSGNVSSPTSPAPALQNPLPASGSLPSPTELRSLSAGNQTPLDGSATLLQSGGAEADGSALVLDAAAGSEWGVWSFNPACLSVPQVSVQLASAPGQQAWLGLANYETRRWDWIGPFIAGAAANLDLSNHCSPEGNIYCAVVAAAGRHCRVERLVFTLDDVDQTPIPLSTLTDPASWTSICIADGCPAIAYWNPGIDDLCYIRASSSCGSSWGEARTLDSQGHTGRYCSICIVAGNPAICYYDETISNLRYIRALDSRGDAWDTPKMPVSPAFGGEYCSLEIVDGRPAISYLDVVTNELRFVRANDEFGWAWQQSVKVDGSGPLNAQTRLLVADGFPAIAYSTSTPWGVHYIRALDAAGVNWGPPQTLNTEEVCDLAGMTLVSGIPTICFTYGHPNTVALICAQDPAGQSWGAAKAVGALAAADWLSLTAIGGLPVIACSNFAAQLNVLRASDPAGEGWSVLIDLGPASGLGTATSIIGIDGHAAVTYFNEQTDELCWARAF